MAHLLEDNLDVVIVDQGDAYFEGQEILERLHASWNHIEILVLARHHDMRCCLTSLNLGAADYFEKPVARKDPETAVRACLLINRLPDNPRNGPTLEEFRQ
jgi:FixJ family two-component response regulator